MLGTLRSSAFCPTSPPACFGRGRSRGDGDAGALPTSSAARGPDGIADVAEKVIDAVVNISTSQKVEARNTPMPQLPNDPQLDELFRDFFNRRGQGDPRTAIAPRAASTRSAPASSSMPRASWSPTTT